MTLTLTQFAKAGFTDLSVARDKFEALAPALPCGGEEFLEFMSPVADPDRALEALLRLEEKSPAALKSLLNKPEGLSHLLHILGGSSGLADFLMRHPRSLRILGTSPKLPGNQEKLRSLLCKSVQAHDGFAELTGDVGRDALRVQYRELLTQIALFDLTHADPQHQIDAVTGALSDIAGAALEAALCVARTEVSASFSRNEVALVDLAIIGMGKCGARELNYLSDVDVIYVARSLQEDKLGTEKMLTIATRLAQHVARAINDVSREPGLWELDANLRPEGKDGALVRTLESHVAYYERWAKDWEFQALLKARPIAGGVDLGQEYVDAVAPKVWSSASRKGFVEQVQRMRERVTENIPTPDVDFQVKLGPGGLRDVEFTVQLLQLVHGLTDDAVRTRGTLESLTRLSNAGYVGRTESAGFAESYRFLRLLEHRMQLRDLRRTHLMPRTEPEQRILARSTGMFATASDVITAWHKTKLQVRELHQRLFYRPLLAAVATLGDDALALSNEQAEARLAAIGFRDPAGALRHIAALTTGVSRRASIQRTLLPVMLQWFSDGADPDNGLLSFRRLSEELGESPWFLRMVRDSAGAAQRLTQVLSGSRFVADLMERIPESAAWFDGNDQLQPTSLEALMSEVETVLGRHADEPGVSVKAIKAMRRREVLRLAISAVVGAAPMQEIAQGLSDVTTVALSGYLKLSLSEADNNPEFGIVAMGRYGGSELGFGSDADVIYVYRATSTCQGEEAQKRAEQIVIRIAEIADDARLSFEIDTELRPEGKNGPLVRSLESYAAYYERWSLLWEAQALLRARPVAGSIELLADMMTLIDGVRYPETVTADDVREIRRIKARVEAERLPQAADPTRHVKLGRGSLSDVEWTAQLLQLQYAHAHPQLRTTSTQRALEVAAAEGLIDGVDATQLTDAWRLASRVRSGILLWSNKSNDVLPSDVTDLDGIARLLGYHPHRGTELEQDYLSATRRSRGVFERVFYGFS